VLGRLKSGIGQGRSDRTPAKVAAADSFGKRTIMIRKLSLSAHYLHSSEVARNFGGWDAGLYRAHAANIGHERAMQVFKRRRPPVSLQLKRGWKDEASW
jgi:hypothetical protein